jgi:serine/threonine-protein kinase
MDAERWRRIQDVFEEAAVLPREARDAFLSVACEGDPELRAEVVSLLSSAETADTFLSDIASRAGLGAVHGPPSSSVEVPKHAFGPYRATRLLGRGGMGAVFVAERSDDQFKMEVALKALAGAPLRAESRARFLSERQILAGLHHPNIAQLLDGGVSDDGTPFFVMELVEGRSIDAFCEERGLSVEDRLELFLQVCAGVGHAHTNLVVHRDLKPSNILVTDDGTVKLLDFGIARMLQSEDALYLTATQAPHPMTVAYASPEQIRGEPPSTSCDVYGLGVLLYRLLTGRHPYDFPEGSGYVELSRVICEAVPTTPSQRILRDLDGRGEGRGATGVNGGPGDGSSPPADPEPNPDLDRRRERGRALKGDLDWIVLKALEKEPGRRYASVAEFAEDIRRHLSGWPVQARPVTFSYRTRRFMGRHRGPVAASAVVAILVLALGVLGVRYVVDTRAQSRALAEEARATQAVSDFLVGLFAVADPRQGGADTLTARALLERGRGRAGEELAEIPGIQARVFGTLAQVYWGLGYSLEADSLAWAQLDLRRQQLGPDHPETLDAALYLAHLRREQGNRESLPLAESIYREVLAQVDGNEDGLQQRIDAEEGLGRTLILLEREEEAVAHLRTALEIGTEILEPNDLNLLGIKGAQAALFRQLEMPDSAELLYRSLIEGYEALGEEGERDVGVVLNNLGYLMRVQDRMDEAEAWYRLSLDGYEHTRAPAETMLLHSNLALVLQEQGNVDEMEDVLRKAVDYAESHWPPEHWRVGAAHNALGQGLLMAGRPERAEGHVSKALEIYEAALGPEHSWTARARGHMGITYRRLGRNEEALVYLEQSYADLLAQDALRSPPSRRIVDELSALYRDMGRPDLAEQLVQDES